jgi:hypothetical protein
MRRDAVSSGKRLTVSTLAMGATEKTAGQAGVVPKRRSERPPGVQWKPFGVSGVFGRRCRD